MDNAVDKYQTIDLDMTQMRIQWRIQWKIQLFDLQYTSYTRSD